MFASKGDTTAPCGVPTFVSFHSPSSDTPAFNHFWIRRITRRSAIRCSTNFTSHSCETYLLPSQAHGQSVQRIMLAAPRPEPVGESQKVLLVDLVEYRHHGLLNHLVLQRGDP